MFFRVLGPLDVLMNGHVTSVGGPKPRALVTALLVRRGAVVPTDALAAAVWATTSRRDPPAHCGRASPGSGASSTTRRGWTSARARTCCGSATPSTTPQRPNA